MARVSVVGNSGSGKSTAARCIAAALDCPHLELDSIFHQEGWTPLPDDELRARVTKFMDAHPHWVIDGNYRRVQDLIWGAADTVVWMHPPKWQNMLNVVLRTLRRVWTREVLWNNNREPWRNLFSVDPQRSIIAWAWTQYDAYGVRYAAAMRDPQWSTLNFVRLRSRAALREWVAQLDSAGQRRTAPDSAGQRRTAPDRA